MVRKITAIMLAICFLVLLITAISMTWFDQPLRLRLGGPPFESSSGGFRHGAEPPRGGHGFFPRELHHMAGYGLLIFGAIHIGLNRRCLLSYVGIGRQR